MKNLSDLPRSCGFNQADIKPQDSKCPVTRYRPNFVPSRLIDEARSGWFPREIRHCISCELCSPDRETSFPACADRIILAAGVREGFIPRAFGGALDACVTLQIKGSHQSRLDWITHDLNISEGNPPHGIGLFVGCAPYYDALLGDKLGINLTTEAHAAVVLLNAVGIDPVVLPDEVCCGGDHLHAADLEGFKKLAHRNFELFKKHGIKKVITACDDCRYTLANRYARYIEGWNIEVIRLIDYLSENSADLGFSSVKKTAAIQPSSMYCDPENSNSVRKLLDRVPDLKVVEVDPVHPSTFGGWNQFDGPSKQLETDFLKACESAGADIALVPSTRVLTRLLEGRRPGSWEQTSIEIRGLYGFLAGNHIVMSEFSGA